MGRLLQIERLCPLLVVLVILLARTSSAEEEVKGLTTGSAAAAPDTEDKTANLRGLSFLGFGEEGSDTNQQEETDPPKLKQLPTAIPIPPPGSVKLIESVPCEPNHEKAKAFVGLFGRIDSGNEACAAEADPDSCAGGCCRFGTYFLCDRINAYTELPCVCNRNTAGNHPHRGHIHSSSSSSTTETTTETNSSDKENSDKKNEQETKQEDPKQQEDNDTTTEKPKESEETFKPRTGLLKDKLDEDEDKGTVPANDSTNRDGEDFEENEEQNKDGLIDAAANFFGVGEEQDNNDASNQEEAPNDGDAGPNTADTSSTETTESAATPGDSNNQASDSSANDEAAQDSVNKASFLTGGFGNSNSDTDTTASTGENTDTTNSDTAANTDDNNDATTAEGDNGEATQSESNNNEITNGGDDGGNHNAPGPEVNEASFTLGWGGPPDDGYDDPGASKHNLGAVSSSNTAQDYGNDKTETNDAAFLSNGWGGDPPPDNESDKSGHRGRELVDFDYDHGPINEAVFLTPFGGEPNY
ncbi:expressed unknown protein [Seminavis robusta]|uniref:Uncharacterized protein n=1 Tax=Seminavis robusta TaxID=568900 RepID=A0A9N8E8C8_9STRA|nr:expressed unknown protein [Seminavis robusta]|eukprot:Sro732_g194460.1 n/a (528) ;mRNA; r:39701-41284